jgi:N-acetylglucosamine-6-phosphate deacetylase
VRLGVEAALVDGVLVSGDVRVDDGLVSAVGVAGPRRGVAVPGLVDLQVNGVGDVDFAAAGAEGYARAGDALLETGVTAFQPTLVTADLLVLDDRLEPRRVLLGGAERFA